MSMRECLFDEIECPSVLYKYRTWDNDFHKEIITKQIVFMANPATFKDNSDCSLQKKYDLKTDEEYYKLYLKHSKGFYPCRTEKQHIDYAKSWITKSPLRNKTWVEAEQRKQLEEFWKKIGVLCLTANPKNFKMWEEYSNSHKGFCLGFNSEMLRLFSSFGTVAYYDELPIISPFDDFTESFMIQVLSKKKKYAFEEEFRVLKQYENHATENDRKFKIPKEYYKEIIFGANQSIDDIRKIISLCEKQEMTIDFYIEKIHKNNEIIIEQYVV